jgi:predicted transcriptional regulator
MHGRIVQSHIGIFQHKQPVTRKTHLVEQLKMKRFTIDTALASLEQRGFVSSSENETKLTAEGTTLLRQLVFLRLREI